jgi:hypothetical protein
MAGKISTMLTMQNKKLAPFRFRLLSNAQMPGEKVLREPNPDDEHYLDYLDYLDWPREPLDRVNKGATAEGYRERRTIPRLK